jgi:hypothetical protein
MFDVNVEVEMIEIKVARKFVPATVNASSIKS